MSSSSPPTITTPTYGGPTRAHPTASKHAVETRDLALTQPWPHDVACYVEALQVEAAAFRETTAYCLRMLFDWLVVGQVIPE